MSAGAPRPAAATPSPPLAAALAAFAAARVPPERIDRVWIFPPRAVGEGESALAVVAAYEDGGEDDGEERRRIYTVRAERSAPVRGRAARTDHVAEQGSAPLARLPRVMAGVVRRLGTEDAAPAEAEIDGDPARWAALLAGAAQP
ncbi:MAG TPA: hypothetical protein VFX29_03265 [Longimicrobiaceae bacterium]|nr:hypothetical protein [Longimicrobiaceae bacterium]